MPGLSNERLVWALFKPQIITAGIPVTLLMENNNEKYKKNIIVGFTLPNHCPDLPRALVFR
jgi:hypothetical protein